MERLQTHVSAMTESGAWYMKRDVESLNCCPLEVTCVQGRRRRRQCARSCEQMNPRREARLHSGFRAAAWVHKPTPGTCTRWEAGTACGALVHSIRDASTSRGTISAAE